jgi:hypothetical protein
VLSGRGLCDGPIPRPEESFRLWCVYECDQVQINNLDTFRASIRCTQCIRRNKPSRAAGDGKAWRYYSEATERNPKDREYVSAECSAYVPTGEFFSRPVWSI